MGIKRIGNKGRRSRKRNQDMPEGEIPMTPMIDVVFLLLIYFVMTMEPPDVFANLNVFTPSPDSPPPKEKPEEPPEVIKIGVFSDGYQFDGVTVTEVTLQRYLGKIGAVNKNTTVMILCASDSSHGSLVRLLNNCAKFGLTNLSVMPGN